MRYDKFRSNKEFGEEACLKESSAQLFSHRVMAWSIGVEVALKRMGNWMRGRTCGGSSVVSSESPLSRS